MGPAVTESILHGVEVKTVLTSVYPAVLIHAILPHDRGLDRLCPAPPIVHSLITCVLSLTLSLFYVAYFTPVSLYEGARRRVPDCEWLG